MGVEKHTKEVYDKFGKEYQRKRIFNELVEVPCMVKTVGNIKDKKLLDIGCGAGVHIKKYLKKGARCWGIDISESMIEMARKNCPNVDFKVGSMTKLPYKNSSFDIVTASLSMDYIKNLEPVFKEVARVLKKGGKFYYSNESPFVAAREKYEDDKIKISGIGKYINKKTGKKIFLGEPWKERVMEWEMLPEMEMKTYRKPFRTQLKDLRKAGFELIDFIHCKPSSKYKDYSKFNKREKEAYEMSLKFPLFSIFVSQKK